VYTAQGRVANKAQQVGSLTQTVGYAYNAAGQRTGIATPSGQVLGFSYRNNRIAGITVNGAPLVSYVLTTPFGPVGAWQWGNGLYTFRDYDADGRLKDWEFRNGTSVLRNNLTWDMASRITAIADPAHAALEGTYQYDALERLAVAQSGTPATHTRQFGYDAVGNRVSLAVDGAPTNLTYGAFSNQLMAMSGAIRPDPLHGDTSRSYTYDLANRLKQVQNGSSTLAAYQVNGVGQRVAKTVGGVVTRFIYDEQGRLLGEYDTDGRLIQETVWLEDLPVATLRPQPGSPTNPVQVEVFYVHADHLGSPRTVTRPADNALMWRWDNVDPFGANAADENPGGQGWFTYGLRFPGQYYDAETGSHYNYFRDYDPAIGRYGQSDPIGLRGGINTYVYVLSPSFEVDQFGLMGSRGPQFPLPPPFGPPYPNGNWEPGYEPQDLACTYPGSLLDRNRCTSKCCLEHDRCYQMYQCNESSWKLGLTRQGPCQGCNRTAAACFIKALTNCPPDNKHCTDATERP
jgi:RHS repeat-associated protein